MLIKHILPETGTGIISGQWGAYKTTIALDLSLSIMTSLNFAGRYRVKRRGGVLYLAPEGAATLTWRIKPARRSRNSSACRSLYASSIQHLVRSAL
jgi:RecA-family ATPase